MIKLFGRKNSAKPEKLKEYWHWYYNISESSYRDLLSDDPIWSSWELSRNPESIAADRFGIATEILCGAGDRGLANAFVERCIEILDRIDAESKCTSDRCVASFPINVGRSTMLRGLIDYYFDRQPEESVFVDAATHFLSYSRRAVEDGVWDAVIQYDFLFAVELLLLGGRPDDAHRELEGVPEALTKNERQHLAIRTLIDSTGKSRSSGEVPDARAGSFFAALRDPRNPPLDNEHFVWSNEAIVQALLRLKYSAKVKPNTISWDDVICELVD